MKGTILTVACVLVAACSPQSGARSSGSGDGDGDAAVAPEEGGTGGEDGDNGTAGTDGTGDTADTGDTSDTAGTEDTGDDCPEQTGQRPGALSEHFGVFDPIKERLVFFGGNPSFPVECIGKNSYLAETWAYSPQCGVWERVAEDGEAPSARGRSVSVYDEKNHAMVIFGGRFRPTGAPGMDPYTMHDDTWRLDLSTDTWSEVQTGDGPSARILSSGVYDPEGERVVIFGGSTANTGLNFFPQNDVWALDTNEDTWSALPAPSPPTARQYHSAIYDPVDHAMIVSGGGDANAFFGPFFGDTWSLSLDTLEWTELHPGGAGSPDRRIWGRAVYAPGIDRMVLWGGHDDGDLGNRNDFWMLDIRAGKWEIVSLGDKYNAPPNGPCDFPANFATVEPGTPERRSAHLLQYWPQQNKLLIHGGKTDCGLIDDLWEIDLKSYDMEVLEPASTGESCLRWSETCSGHCG